MAINFIWRLNALWKMLQKILALLVLLPIACNATLALTSYRSRNSTSTLDQLPALSKFQALGPEWSTPSFMNCAIHCSITVGCSAFSFNETSNSCQPFLFNPMLAEEEEEGRTLLEIIAKHPDGKMIKQKNYTVANSGSA